MLVTVFSNNVWVCFPDVCEMRAAKKKKHTIKKTRENPDVLNKNKVKQIVVCATQLLE